MLLNEWNMDAALAVRREEGRSEGRNEGIVKGREDILALINQGWTTERLKGFLAKKDAP